MGAVLPDVYLMIEGGLRCQVSERKTAVAASSLELQLRVATLFRVPRDRLQAAALNLGIAFSSGRRRALFAAGCGVRVRVGKVKPRVSRLRALVMAAREAD